MSFLGVLYVVVFLDLPNMIGVLENHTPGVGKGVTANSEFQLIRIHHITHCRSESHSSLKNPSGEVPIAVLAHI